jgi:outer membrane protein
MKNLGLGIILLLVFQSTSIAQKYGYLNFGNLIIELPETAEADKKMEAFQKEILSKGESMANAFQEKVNAYVAEVQKGMMAPAEQQRREAALQKERDDILSYEDDMQEKVQAKRQELLQPIVDKIQKALDAIGKEKGYAMIFDSGAFNTLLFVDESDDLAPLVRQKLGLK